MRYRTLPGGAALAAVLILHAGCLTSTQATRLQKDLDDVKRQIFQVQQDSAAARSRIDEVAGRLGAGSAPAGAQAELQSAVRSLLDQVQALSERLKESNTRMASLAQEIQSLREAAPRGSAPPPSAPPASSPASGSGGSGRSQAERAFNSAYADYSKGNYELAVMGFNEFLRGAPAGHPQAAAARYFVGECYYSQGKFKEAVEAFDDVVRRDPAGEKVPAALLKKAYAQIESGQTSPGVTTLQGLIDGHPDSGEAKLAAGRLKELGLRSR